MESDPDPDQRAPFAKAVDLSSRIISAGITMGLLAAGGYWLDGWLGIKGPFLILGALLGTAAFGFQMLAVIRSVTPPEANSSVKRRDESDTDQS